MESTEFARWAISALLGLAVWFMKRTLDQTQQEIKDLKVEQQRIRAEYLHKDDFRDFKTELRSMFEEIKTDIRELKK